MANCLTRGAFRKGAPFLFLGWLSVSLPLLADTPCRMARLDERVVVKKVFDGDTVLLEDGRRVRFIGINTPELSHEQRPAEPLAELARQRLQRLVEESGQQLLLQRGVEQRDRYGRLLAYPFLIDGRSLNAILLGEGLAAALVVPPNEAYRNCHFVAEGRARDRGIGIWGAARFRPWSSETLPPTARGFYLVRGRVEQVTESKRAFGLLLTGGFTLRLPRRGGSDFSNLIKEITGERVEARGWLNYHKGRPMMTIRHPAMLTRGVE